ncbi:HsdR family type I site-specific deoxyribonuclease [Mycoplasma sp. 1654_15]|uniref:HsdR family type I site-specific deoxyribonuclease n=1 Tax=Mycoplasma sp. 1654_15 TaxID=2725994 RepID=UPI002FE36AE7
MDTLKHRQKQTEKFINKSFLKEELLFEQLKIINKDADDQAIKQAIKTLISLQQENPSDLKPNLKFTNWLQNGITVSYKQNNEQKGKTIKLVDFENIENNIFEISQQDSFQEKNKDKKIPDLIVWLNHIPIVVMELKNPIDPNTTIEDAYKQLRNYMYDISSVFIYNTFLVISDLSESKIGTITSSFEHFKSWKTKDGKEYLSKKEINWEVFFEGIFQKEILLDIIKNFICFKDDQETKIIASYHQYWGVKKALARVKDINENKDKNKPKGGVVWHTQGSGKSIFMVFLSKLVRRILENVTIVVITDRNDLDSQLYSTFDSFSEFLQQKPVQMESREDLKEKLIKQKVNGIFFSTIQKFEADSKTLSTRENIIVIADEAHRSHYGFYDEMEIKNEETYKEKKRFCSNFKNFIA